MHMLGIQYSPKQVVPSPPMVLQPLSIDYIFELHQYLKD